MTPAEPRIERRGAMRQCAASKTQHGSQREEEAEGQARLADPTAILAGRYRRCYKHGGPNRHARESQRLPSRILSKMASSEVPT